MARAYSLDLRQKVLSHLMKNGNKTETARLFGITRDTIADWCKRLADERLEPCKTGPVIGSFKKADPKEVCSYVDSHNDITLLEIAEVFKVSHVSIWKILRKSGYVNKKNSYVQRKKRDAEN